MGQRSVSEIIKTIRQEIKKEFPDCKFSVTKPHHNEISISLMSAPFNPFDGDKTFADPREPHVKARRQGGYAQLNHYYINQVRFGDDAGKWTSNAYLITEEAAQLFIKVTEIATRERYNNSNSQIDYFDTNYYLSLQIGKLTKDFEIK